MPIQHMPDYLLNSNFSAVFLKSIKLRKENNLYIRTDLQLCNENTGV